MVFWPLFFHTTVMMLFWLMSVTCSGSCPDNVMTEAFSCLHNLTQDRDSEVLLNAGDIKLTKKNCDHRNFDDSVRCLRNLYDSCKNSREYRKLELLQKYASPDAWNSGFQRLCQNMDLYTKKADCITKQNQDIMSCINSKKVQVNKPSESVSQYDSKSSSITEAELSQYCGLFQLTNYCFSQPIGEQCGQDVSSILRDFTGGITPPVCREYSVTRNWNSSASQTFTSISTILISCFVSICLWVAFL